MNTIPDKDRHVKGDSTPTNYPENHPSKDGESSQSSLLVYMRDSLPPEYTDLRHVNAVNRRFALQNIARDLLPDYRVAQCMRLPHGEKIDLYHHAEFSSASYGGLQTCGSVHVCSVCGTKIGERRAQEVNTGATRWIERGGGLFMATYTLSHKYADPLDGVSAMLHTAYRQMQMGRRWKLFQQRMQQIGTIVSKEYTYGENGWHPHLHVLVFTERGLSRSKLESIETWLKTRWGSAISNLGGTTHWDYGVQVAVGNQALADYVTKAGKNWTIGDELAKPSSKLGKRSGNTIPQLLWSAGHNDYMAGQRFQEYAIVTKGTRQLRWSPGLRKLLGLDEEEKTDSEVAEEITAGGKLLVQFDRRAWRVILANDLRAEVLLTAAAGDVELVIDFLKGFGIELTVPESMD